MSKNFQIGFDYYPEHWPEEMWDNDLEMMKACGTNCVRIAEFAWSRMEPEEGRFEFDWLDRFFALCEKHDMGVILGTPTAAVPPWLWQRYPYVVALLENGQRASTTGRRYFCPNSPDLLNLSDIISEKMAERYGAHKQLVGWQTDNELNGQVCYCGYCQTACREWLKGKYDTVEAFNSDHGNVFWAHEVNDWDEVKLPRLGLTTSQTNPAVRLDVHRFFSDSWRDFVGRQVEIIRKYSPQTWTTHNLPGHGIAMDLYDLAAAHDFISMDTYPKATIDPPARVGFQNDIANSMQKRPHWIMEIQTGTPCTKFYKAPVPRPGQLRLWAHQSAAHGAEGVVFFRWRKSPVGAEMFGNGILDQDSRPRRQYDEAVELGKDFDALRAALPEYATPDEVGVVFDFAERINSQIHQFAIDVDYFGTLQSAWESARRLGLNVRFVRPTDDLSSFKMVIAPAQYTTSPEIVSNFTKYVEDGGTLVGGGRMGWFDVFGKPSCKTMPGGMTDLFGVEVEEYERVMETNPNRVIFSEEIGGAGDCSKWNYYLNDLGAKPLGKYESEFYAGKTAISLNEVGAGRAVYVGATLDEAAQDQLMTTLALMSGLELLPVDWLADVETVRLEDGGGNSIFAFLNHSNEEKTVSLNDNTTDLITGEAVIGVTLAPLSAAWVRQ